jgi:predicted permease
MFYRREFFKPHLRLIALIGVIVPQRLRADWRQEWLAELQYREALLADWDHLNWRTRFDLLRRSAGAFWDALWLQPQRLEDEMFQDVRYGIRMLKKQPGFTMIAAFTLALGIGASTAIFSVVNPILFESLPFPHAERIQMLWDFGNEGARLHVTFGTYREVLERNHSFDALAVMRSWQPSVTGTAQPERLEGQRVSAAYFQVFAVQPALGRDFDSSDDQVNGPKVAMLSDRLWRRRFAGDPGVIGQQVALDANLYTIIGVMPATFENLLAPTADIWSPLQYDPSLAPDSREWGHHLSMVGRLRPGVTAEQARRELDGIAQAPVPQFARPPYAAIPNGLMVNSLQADVTSDIRPALLAVMCAVLLVLVIACVNVTNLMLARGAQRRGEFAIRTALGAARARLVRQLLIESLLLALLGGAFGLILAQTGVQGLIALSPPGLPRAGAIRLDGAAFAFALAVTTIIGLAVGLIPALHVSRSDLHTEVKQNSRTSTGTHQWTRRSLVVAEVALALVLLVSAGLLLRSLQRLLAIDPGFDNSHLLTLQVQTAGHRFDDEATHRFFDETLEAVRRVPGVNTAAFTSQLPLSGDLDDSYGVHFESSPSGSPDADQGAFRYAITPGYCEAMGIPLRRGRLLNEHDTADAVPAVLISESLAKSKFLDQDPIGQRLRIGANDSPWQTVVGVVGNVKQTSLAVTRTDAVYLLTTQWRMFVDRTLWLTVRTQGDAASLAPAVRQAIWSVDKDQPIVKLATMDERLAVSTADRRFALTLFEAFGLVALVLAATGIYGVLSGSVTERTREIGVRLALGAQRRDVLALILRQGAKLALSGIAIGLAAAWLTTGLLVKLLYGVSATDPLTFAAIPLLLITVALLACWLPARRATKIDPIIALRCE